MLPAKKRNIILYLIKVLDIFSIETAGHFDLEAELKIYVAGMDTPICKKFNKNLDIYQLQAILAEYVLR